MFCIAAFIVLAVISIFSARYRKLAVKAWSCTARRVTLRPCDTSFKEETKNRLLSHVAKRTPRLVKSADIGIEVASFLLVILTIWSLATAIESGLNLFVWGTCSPSNASSCSLSSESCSINTVRKSLWELTTEGKPWVWFANEASDFGNTIANIPTRLQNWDATKYLPQNATYYNKFDSTKPTALEITDPGCVVCQHLFNNIKSAGFENKYNLTYIAYPIKNPDVPGKYKYANSYIVTQYLEAIKINPLKNLKHPADWQVLEKIYTGHDNNGLSYQTKINTMLDADQTINLISGWLKDMGYNSIQLKQIKMDANSQKVANIIKQNQAIVNNKIKTVKIPTLIFNGQQHGGLVNTNDLH
jgi:hypothetical protein